MATTDVNTADTARAVRTIDGVVDIIASTAPEIRTGLPGRRVTAEDENPSGETQMAADVFADDLLCERIGALDGVGEYASEERPDVIDIGEGVSVALDPLDGSTNLKPNNVMGTLYSIYDEPLPTGGENLLAAGYILYGPVTTLVAGRDGVVSEYILESGIKRPLREELTLPGDPAIFSFGGRVNRWFDDFEAFARETERTEGMKLRYGGSMIGDVNQILHYGGVFAYPAQTDAPGGKLRQQFEGFPIGYIIECAGGRSSDGEQSLLSGTPEDIHDRVPVYIGNDSLVESLETRLD